MSSRHNRPVVLPWRPREVHVVERSRAAGVFQDAPPVPLDLEAVRAEAFAAGLAQGRAEASSSSASGVAERLSGALLEIDGRVNEELSAASEAYRELALAIGARLAGAAIAAGDHDPARLLSEALALGTGNETRVLMSSGDLVAITSEQSTPDARWQADPSLALGEFVIETASGRLLATLEARIESLREGIAP